MSETATVDANPAAYPILMICTEVAVLRKEWDTTHAKRLQCLQDWNLTEQAETLGFIAARCAFDTAEIIDKGVPMSSSEDQVVHASRSLYM